MPFAFRVALERLPGWATLSLTSLGSWWVLLPLPLVVIPAPPAPRLYSGCRSYWQASPVQTLDPTAFML
ncbi:hypothetical protein PG993_008055 [Apiospora rasikravindrae]|uniref:Uncharacterized protein n=1 Tax=Apiospora rasikravindrae TaxID=990691 RepID=A0ABR1SZ95_9PEZI